MASSLLFTAVKHNSSLFWVNELVPPFSPPPIDATLVPVPCRSTHCRPCRPCSAVDLCSEPESWRKSRISIAGWRTCLAVESPRSVTSLDGRIDQYLHLLEVFAHAYSMHVNVHAGITCTFTCAYMSQCEVCLSCTLLYLCLIMTSCWLLVNYVIKQPTCTQVQTLGRKTVQMLLLNNPSQPTLFRWVVDRCYDSRVSCAQLCFHALSNTIAEM